MLYFIEIFKKGSYIAAFIYVGFDKSGANLFFILF